MAEIKILVEGYADRQKQTASSTVIFIQDEDVKIIVDPGIDRPRLLAAFYQNNIDFGDINYVFLTHYHPDHILLAGLFTSAKIIDGHEMSDFLGNYQESEKIIPGTSTQIIYTPGHDAQHYSLLVIDEIMGKTIIAGDAIWWWDDERVLTDFQSLIQRVDQYVKDQCIIQKSRQNILDQANYIIPGHGKLFEVSK